ncbi:MAG: hypothetical protein ABIZ07_10365 [Dermatophilaceae bacterium]
MTTPVHALKDFWDGLSGAQRASVATVAVLDLSLRGAALIDLSRRPQRDVRGPKWLWALSLSVVNSVGLLPIAYFVRGRGHEHR